MDATDQPAWRARELSWRALLPGLLLGALLAVCNTYMGLKIGWFDTGSLTAALVGFGLLRALRQTPTHAEHNVLQTLASAIATTPATAGLVGAIPALGLASGALSAPALAAWSIAVGLWGVAVALPLRRQLLDDQSLPFPTGAATAELITSVGAAEADARQRGRLFAAAMGAAALVTFLRDGPPGLLPTDWLVPLALGAFTAEAVGLGVAVSPLSLGAGVMAGPRIGASMLLGAVVAHAVAPPWLHARGLVEPTADSVSAWLIWPGVGVLVGSSVPTLLRLVKDLPRGVAALRSARGASAAFPLLALGSFVVAALAARSWGASPWAVLAGFIVSLPLIAVSTRAAGQTDIAPLAPMGQLTQVLASLVGGGGLSSTLSAGAVPAGAGAQTANTFWTLKAGRLLGARDEPQLLAQALGVAVGAAVCTPLYLALVARFPPGSEALPAPWASQWRAVAELLQSGGQSLPPGAAAAFAASLALGVGLALGEERKWAWVPSPLALGLAMLLPASLSATIALGGAVAWGLERRGGEARVTAVGLPMAAGVIAGESVLAVLVVALTAAGVLGG